MVSIRSGILWPSILLLSVANLFAQQSRSGSELRHDTASVKRVLSILIEADSKMGALFAQLDSVIGTDWKATVNFMLNEAGEPAIPFTLDISFTEPANVQATYVMHELPSIDRTGVISCRDIESAKLKGRSVGFRTLQGDTTGAMVGTFGMVNRLHSSALVTDLLVEGPDLTMAQAIQLLEKHGHSNVVVRDDPSVLPRMIRGRVLESGSDLRLTLHLPKPERGTVAAGDEWSTRKYDGFTFQYGDSANYIYVSAQNRMYNGFTVGGYNVPLVVPISMDPCR